MSKNIFRCVKFLGNVEVEDSKGTNVIKDAIRKMKVVWRILFKLLFVETLLARLVRCSPSFRLCCPFAEVKIRKL